MYGQIVTAKTLAAARLGVEFGIDVAVFLRLTQEADDGQLLLTTPLPDVLESVRLEP